MSFILPRLKKCCCCLSLRTGCLLIGYVSILFSILGLSTVTWSLYTVVTSIAQSQNQTENQSTENLDGEGQNKTEGQDLEPGADNERLAVLALQLYILHAYFLLVLLYYLIVSALLVIGVHTSKPRLLRYYFNLCLFLVVLALALVVLNWVFMGYLVALPLIKWSIILIYCIIVVRSTVLDMEERTKRPAFEMQSLYSPPAPISQF